LAAGEVVLAGVEPAGGVAVGAQLRLRADRWVAFGAGEVEALGFAHDASDRASPAAAITRWLGVNPSGTRLRYSVPKSGNVERKSLAFL
jgi:hypothetical protein